MVAFDGLKLNPPAVEPLLLDVVVTGFGANIELEIEDVWLPNVLLLSAPNVNIEADDDDAVVVS